jgi:hypothetical protein
MSGPRHGVVVEPTNGRGDAGGGGLRKVLRRLGIRVLLVLGAASVPAGAGAQILSDIDPPGYDWYYLYLREPSPIDGADPFSLITASRVRLTHSMQDSPPDPCVDAWTSGSYALPVPPVSWTSATAPPLNAAPEWLPIRVDLSAFAGRAVSIFFTFHSDSVWNAHEGVFVDSIRIGPLSDGLSFFSNGADTADEEWRMLSHNAQASPRWHATARQSAEGGRSWWFGNESGPGEGGWAATARRLLRRPAPADEALDASHPYYWAPFQIFGL